jgi:hypothetical protein
MSFFRTRDVSSISAREFIFVLEIVISKSMRLSNFGLRNYY